MKKIIAMLLCVAMIAAFGVNAFAAVTTTALTSGMPDVEKAGDRITDIYKEAIKEPVGTAALAASLSAAKKAYNTAVKNYNELLGKIGDAAKAAQYEAVASYYNAANVILDINVQDALQDFVGHAYYDAYYAVADAVYDGIVDDAGNKLYADAYDYMAATWPGLFHE